MVQGSSYVVCVRLNCGVRIVSEFLANFDRLCGLVCGAKSLMLILQPNPVISEPTQHYEP